MQKEKDKGPDEGSFENLKGDNDDDSEITGGEVEEGEVQTEEDLDETGE
jgi:hypothetical protein